MSERNTEEVENDPLIGKRLASYEILRKVARGGMGVVYKARHVYIDKIVALKVLDPELSTRDDLIERFRTEAQSLARVEHENVVKVIDIIEEDGIHFIVMDFAEGQNLRVYIKNRGPLSESEIVSVARQTAEAVYAAHKQGILHRDIKPENIIRNSRGRCKLADFGLAGDLRLIKEGHEGPLNFGTPAFSAPEVLRRMTPDVRSDVFSFGASLYFAATGEPPFGKTGTAQIMLRQKQGAELLESIRADLSPALCRLIHDCINLHPKNRPVDFRDVLSALPSRASTRVRGSTATSTRPITHQTSPTGNVDSRQFETTTESTRNSAVPAGRSLVGVWIAVGVVALVIVLAVVKFVGNSSSVSNANPDENTSARSENRASNSGNNRPQNQPSNRPPDNGPKEPAYKLVDEAFGAAELHSKMSLSNADYAAAYGAWDGFLSRYSDSDYASEAREKRQSIKERVDNLRKDALAAIESDMEAALAKKRTAEAMKALERFPAELKIALSNSDTLAEIDRLETLKQEVLSADASALVSLFKRADKLRDDWTKKYLNKKSSVSIQRVYAGRLLDERKLLQDFLIGRLDATQKKVNDRLASVRKLLESAHQRSDEALNARRKYHDEIRPEWALRVLDVLGSALESSNKRDFTAVDILLTDEMKNLREQRNIYAQQQPAALQASIKADDFIYRLVSKVRDDFRVAAGINVALEDSFNELLATGRVIEVTVHSGFDADGKRSGKLDLIKGRVSDSEDSYVIIDKKRVEFSLIRDKDVSRLIRDSGDYRAIRTVCAWLVAIGKTRDAKQALARLEKIETTPKQVMLDVRTWVKDEHLASDARAKISFLAAWLSLNELEVLEPDTAENQLLLEMQSVLKGQIAVADSLLDKVRDLENPELVNLGIFEKAMGMAESRRMGDIKVQAVLEPENSQVHWVLSKALEAGGDTESAEQSARKALWLDPSLESAWTFLQEKK